MKKKKNDIERLFVIKFMTRATLILFWWYSVILVGSYVPCIAQKQTYIWYFSKNMGLDFNTDPPTILSDGQLTFDPVTQDGESAASISDSNGNLLFYTDGVSVWNRQHEVMPSGTGLWGHGTTTQTLIVPRPNHSTEFYIFTASPEGDTDFFPAEKRGFRYSVVDLSLDNGLGDVTMKNILLTNSSTEKIAATMHANGIDVWVTMHELNNNFFNSFLVTSEGITELPVKSAAGLLIKNNNVTGQLKFSPNGEMLAMSLWRSNSVALFNFDRSNGKIFFLTNLIEFESQTYGIEFSPNSNFLYVTHVGCSPNVFQFNLNSTSSIEKSRVALENSGSTCDFPGQLQLASDGRIYLAILRDPFHIGVINFPNENGVACNYESNGMSLPINGINYCFGGGLPNFISSYFYNPELYPPRPYFEMPNVFTPNGDGLNEKFVPLQKYNVASFYIQIYNRWGQQVFETNDLENGWDGGDFTSGVYYWFAQYTGVNEKSYTQKGWVQLIR
jgi:gliding motility-associated-like protein